MALYMVFIEDAEDRNGERCIMPTSEHLEDMVVLARQTGAYVFCFVDRAQHLAMMKSIGMYDERLNSDEKATYFFTGKNPQWERNKPTGMKLCDYLYRKVERFAIENGVQVVDAGKCSPEQINAMIDVVSERHGESAVNEKLKAELMREYNSRYFNVPVPELPEDKPARRWWPFGKNKCQHRPCRCCYSSRAYPASPARVFPHPRVAARTCRPGYPYPAHSVYRAIAATAP